MPLELAQRPRSREDVDYACITGNYAIASGIKLTEAFIQEKMLDEHINVVAVRNEDRDAPFVKDIIAGYKSEEFKKLIDTDPEESI